MADATQRTVDVDVVVGSRMWLMLSRCSCSGGCGGSRWLWSCACGVVVMAKLPVSWSLSSESFLLWFPLQDLLCFAFLSFALLCFAFSSLLHLTLLCCCYKVKQR